MTAPWWTSPNALTGKDHWDSRSMCRAMIGSCGNAIGSSALEPTTERYDASFSRSGCQPVTTVCLSGRTVVAFAERFHGAMARTRLTG